MTRTVCVEDEDIELTEVCAVAYSLQEVTALIVVYIIYINTGGGLEGSWAHVPHPEVLVGGGASPLLKKVMM